jgi:Pvc16 N-terminal domain
MIDDLDRTLEELLKRGLPADLVSQVTISFAAPDDQFPPSSVTPPAVDLFLYDVRENRELRSGEWAVERHGGAAVRVPPAVRVDCSYLVTAWASAGSTTPARDEHRLLGEVMKVLLRYEVLPAEVLQGSLRGQEPPLPASTLQPGRLQSLGEFWQALGGKPKAALSYTVTISVIPGPPVEAGPPVLEKVLAFEEPGGQS